MAKYYVVYLFFAAICSVVGCVNTWSCTACGCNLKMEHTGIIFMLTINAISKINLVLFG